MPAITGAKIQSSLLGSRTCSKFTPAPATTATTHVDDDQIARGRDLAARQGIHQLNDDELTIEGALFLGSTLWTDLLLNTGRSRRGPGRRNGA
jgi:hypothetical protein